MAGKKGPGFWSDVGKKTSDLLYKDFSADQRFSLSSTTSTGLTFSSFGVKKGDVFDGDFTTTYVCKNVTVDVKVDTQSKIFSTVKVDDLAPGTRAIFNFSLPDQKSGKMELQYCHQYAGVTGSVGLASSPVVECTSAFGSNDVVIGGEAAFDTASGNFTKYNAGVGINKPEFTAAVVVADKGDTLKASYSHVLSPFTRTTVGAEISHKLSTKANTFSIGGMYGLDALTTIKARLNNHGRIAAVVQHEWRPKSVISMSGEVDTKALEKSAKLGLALSLKP
ncbi:hypothetical protein SELMODRAFT_267998 [Selaginella moellendorffii]|uniref:Uncharacterized protein n=1 Tax=Selaginella moellendorffii TaxID=88036 RepID=D8RZR8_SELML|nr:mitochondrial outer membrane protein porin of 36 kDa [Selaginella moellendorffii]EFJ22200.1 hypothetical protein SELMODRAFT_267998 [Selaginella moellendorffii]|eukprot:XP_002976531.1 mitochondrial outer membrane protein porin of 36 kDa [Selaginella moellendorffii]